MNFNSVKSYIIHLWPNIHVYITLDKLLNNSELQFPLCKVGRITVPCFSVVRIKSYIPSSVQQGAWELRTQSVLENWVFFAFFFNLNNLTRLGKADLVSKFCRKVNLIHEYYFPNNIHLFSPSLPKYLFSFSFHWGEKFVSLKRVGSWGENILRAAISNIYGALIHTSPL